MNDPTPGTTLSADTSAAAEDVQLRLWREMSDAEKARLVTALSQSADALARAGILHHYPAASARECFLRLAIRRLGIELASRAYPEIATLSDVS